MRAAGTPHALQVRTDPERREERHLPLGQLQDRRIVQVVIVIVRHDHGVDLGQLRDRHRHGLKALRARKRHGRRALAPHGIGQHTGAVDLQQHRRMPEPGGAQARLRRVLPSLQWTLGRQGRARRPPLPSAQELGNRGRGRALLQPLRHPRRIDERAVDIARRCLHALEAQTSRVSSDLHAPPSEYVIARPACSLRCARRGPQTLGIRPA